MYTEIPGRRSQTESNFVPHARRDEDVLNGLRDTHHSVPSSSFHNLNNPQPNHCSLSLSFSLSLHNQSTCP
jgi:hypothetical protein